MKIRKTLSQYKVQISVVVLFFIFSLYFFQNITYAIVILAVTVALFFFFEVTIQKEQKNKDIKDIKYETIKFSTLKKITKE